MIAGDGLKIGQLVCSKCGRDRGSYYLVLEIAGNRVYLVDGIKRKMENPKMKNIKHLQIFPSVAGQLADQWEAGQQVSNNEVRKSIAAFRKFLLNKEIEQRG